MKRQHKTGDRPTIRKRMFKIYRKHRFNQSFYFEDPLYRLNHSLSVAFMCQECNYYGYTFTGYDTSPREQGYRSHEDYDAVQALPNEGIIVIDGEGIHKEIDFNRYVYTHEPKDVTDIFIKEVLYTTFDEIAQRRIAKKKSQNLDRQALLRELSGHKDRDGFPEFRHSNSDYYFWPIYDLLESIACTVPHITKWHTHQCIMLSNTITIDSGLQYRLENADNYEIEKCLALFQQLIRYEKSDLTKNDEAATVMANDLIRDYGYYPMDRDTIIMQAVRDDYDPYNNDHHRRQLLATVLNNKPIPVPAGFALCDIQGDINNEASAALLEQVRSCSAPQTTTV